MAKQRLERLAALLSVILWASGSPGQAFSNIQQAKLYYYNSQPDKAITYCDWALSRHTDDAEAYYLKGQSYAVLQAFDKAIASYTKALAITQSALHKPLPAGKYAAADLKFSLARIYQGRGNAYLRLAHYEKAASDLSEAIKIRPRYKPNYLARAMAYERLAKPALAQKDSQLARTLPHLERSAMAPLVWQTEAESLYFRKGYVTALMFLDKVLAMDPKYADAHLLRGKVHLKMHGYKLAIASFNEVLKIAPQDSETLALIELAKAKQRKPPKETDDDRAEDDSRFAN